MATVIPIRELRPQITTEFTPGPFVARTPAIADAYAWGKELHAGQTRMSGEPYFETHCAWVAMFIDNLVGNEAWTIAGLLHDSVEDSGESLDRIRARFPGPLGEEVAHIVDGVTKISNPRDGSSRELETLRKIARFRDPGVFLVKLADKSHNMLTLDHMPPAKQVQKATEAIRAYGKLLGILNCYRWRRWMEDIAFPYADRENAEFIQTRVDSDPRLKIESINEMMGKLGRVMDKAGVPGRVELTLNGYYQTWQKLRRMARQRRSSMQSLENVNDLVSFRLVVDQEDIPACYRLLGEVNRFLGPYLDNDRFDDYIANPQNGYRAIQVTGYMPLGAVEIAIATAEMEGENAWGVVYALQHGKDISAYRPVEILTPTGGARFVPEGSSVLDAVASIQQEFLLDKISAVEVNGALAKLSDRVRPGDVVEVITGVKRITPSPEWLTFANLSTTRMLRSVLATEALRRAAEKGRQVANAIIRERSLLALEDVQDLLPDRSDRLLEQVGAASLTDLYAALGEGAIRSEDLAKALVETGITEQIAGWTSIMLIGGAESNRPGVLVELAGLVSGSGGNILRSVNTTLPDGSFRFRLVVGGLCPETRASLAEAFRTSSVSLTLIDVV